VVHLPDGTYRPQVMEFYEDGGGNLINLEYTFDDEMEAWRIAKEWVAVRKRD
jgi:hypothetical protein